MFKCRFCEEEIDHLNYSVSTREYGTASIGNDGVDNWDCDDTENDGDYNYYCPHCDESSTDPERLYEEVDEDEDDEDRPAEQTRMEDQSQNSRMTMGRMIIQTDKLILCIKCNGPRTSNNVCACVED